MSKRKLTPDDPEFMARILAGIDKRTPEEIEARLKWRPEGIEETDMNKTLQEYDQKKLATLRDEWIEKWRIRADEEAKKHAEAA